MAGDRLTGLDASFLHIEDASTHMHVGSVMTFEGPPPPYDELLDTFERRLSLVPRYRQRLAFVPFAQGRPSWVDDPHLNLRYHVRSTALPSPGSERQLKDLAGRVFSQQLDRDTSQSGLSRTTGASTSASSATSTCSGASTTSPRMSRSRSTSSPPRPVSSSSRGPE